jgi:drug/metabolite transporter (DMT)-like permease
MPAKEKNALTPFHLLAFATSFAMVGICTALALQGGSNPLTVVTARTLASLALLVGWFVWTRVSLRVPRREVLLALAIGLPLSANNYMINAALGEIPVPLAVLIFYLWPAITTAAAWALGKERFRWRAAAGLAAAFAGVGLAVNVEFSAAQAKGVWLALGASVAWSATYLLTGHYFHGRDTRPATFYMMLTALAVFVALCALTGAVALPRTAAGWTGMAGVGLFYAFALIGLFAAMKLGAARASFYMNFEPVASVLLAALILGQTLAPVQLAGAALVIAALFLFRPPPRSAPASPSRRS